MKSKFRSLKYGIPLIAISGIVVISILLLIVFYFSTTGNLTKEVETSFSQFEIIFNDQVATNSDDLKMAMGILLNDKKVIKQFADKDRKGLTDNLLALYKNDLKAKYDIAQFQFHLPPATSFLRLHKPEKFGDDLSSFRETVIKANADKKVVAGIEVGRGGPGLRIVAPVFHDGTHIGSVEFGGSIDKIMDVASSLHLNYAIAIKQSVFEKARRFNDAANDVVKDDFVYYRYSNPGVKGYLSQIDHNQKMIEYSIEDKHIITSYFPIKDFSGAEVGRITLFEEITPLRKELANNILYNTMFIILFAVIISFITYRVLKSFVLNPINRIIDFTREREKGNRTITITTNENEEFALLSAALNRMAEKINQQLSYLDKLPTPVMLVDNNFTIEYMNDVGVSLGTRSREQLIGTKCYDYFKTKHCNTDDCAVYRAMNENRMVTSETVAKPMDKDMPIMYSGTPIKDRDKKIVGALEYVIDISDIKEREEYLKRSTKNIMDAMVKFSEGDLTVSINAENPNDDIGKLFQAFNLTTGKIKQMLLEITNAVEQTVTAVNQISSSSEEMAAGAEEQSSQTNEVASAVEEMNATIFETSKNVSLAADNAKSAGDIAKQGGNVVERNVQGLNNLSVIVEGAVKNIEKLGKSSEEIGQIIMVIDEIAEQTNMLALNAAIEAARAGEHGRGFAIVADEVRKLAERTTKATNEIADMIKVIQRDTNESVTSIKSGSDEVQNSRNLAQEAGEVLKSIIESSGKVVDDVTQVAATSEQQSSTAEEIGRSINLVSNVTSEFVTATQEIAGSAEKLNNLTHHLEHLIRQFKFNKHNTFELTEYDR